MGKGEKSEKKNIRLNIRLALFLLSIIICAAVYLQSHEIIYL